MENVNRWYFTKDQLANTPSRKCDIDYPKELSYRQQAANFIQDMGQRLQLSQLCINTAIVYMHRFYVFHSFTEVHRNNLSISALFLAAKVEEQPRKLEHVIKVAHVCLHKDAPALDVRSEPYGEKAQEVVAHENILLQTLGFVLAIEHPHTYVVKVCQLVKASKDLAQSSYLMATTSLHMTTMCIQYKPTVVACVCIHLACKWSSYLIEPCSEGREWFYYVDRTVTLELLEKLTQEFIAILETSPHRFNKRKFGKESAGYHNPKSIIENAAKVAKEACASSEKRNGLSIKKETSPGPSTSLSFDFCPDFDEKPAVRLDNDRSIEMQSVKKPPVMSVSKKVPEVKISKKPEPVHKPHIKKEPDFQMPEVKKEVDLDLESISQLASLSSEKRNGLSPILDPPTPMDSYGYSPMVVTKPIINPYIFETPSSGPSSIETYDYTFNPSLEIKQEVVEKSAPDVPVSSSTSSKKSDSHSSSKHERREKHKSKHSSHSKDKHSHGEQPPAGIKVKIRKDIVNIKGKEPSQKTVAPPPQPESPKQRIKIKISRPPETPTTTPLKILLLKDKSGSGSYSTSHKNERDSRKRSHSSSNAVASNSSNYKNSHETPTKYQKSNHATSSQKSHHKTDGYPTARPNKVSRHGSHHSNNPVDVHNQKLQANDKTTFHHVQNYNYPLQPPQFMDNVYNLKYANTMLGLQVPPSLDPPLPAYPPPETPLPLPPLPPE